MNGFSGKKPAVGVVFPQTEYPLSSGAVREFARAIEGAGFDHLLAGYHDVGVDPDRAPAEWASQWPLEGNERRPAHKSGDEWHEVFVLFGFLTAAAPSLAFMTNVVPMPQRSTVVVAKEAAEVDLLSDGKLRLGVGVGWNRIEFEAVGGQGPFTERGKVLDEQIEVFRRLWTGDVRVADDRFHRLAGVSIDPLPVQRPIPIWLGSGSKPPSIERVARLADGWIPIDVPGHGLDEAWHAVRRRAEGLGRDPGSIGLQAVVPVGDGNRERIARQLDRWRGLGATHVALDARRAGLEPPALLDRLCESLELVDR